jgi:hypothetical protein
MIEGVDHMRCALLLMTPLPAFAQDRPTAAESVYPAPCIVLEAQLRAGFDEARTDTARIQKALDGCEPGKAVELRVDGDRNLFARWICARASHCWWIKL